MSRGSRLPCASAAGRVRRAAAAAVVAVALAAAPAGAAGDPAAVLPGEAGLSPLHRMGGVERHTPDTLPEGVGGETGRYRGFGLAASAHARYQDPADPHRRVALSAFLFSDPLGAFGVFAASRPAECFPVARIGNGGCLGDHRGFFWQGDLFVLADAAGPEATRASDVRRALQAAAALAGPPPPRPEPLRAFSRFVDTRSITYAPQHLLGTPALPPGLEGRADGLQVFLSVGPCDTARSEAALAAYAATLAGAERFERNGFRMAAGRDPALGPVVLAGS